MKNKKGFLIGEETLKIIISVIVITFLVWFLYSLYQGYSKVNELEKAKESLNFLVEEINVGSEEVMIFGPGEWGISSWNKDSTEKIPGFCKEKKWNNCICFCQPPRGSVNTYTGSCLSVDREGIICKEINFSVFHYKPLEVNNNIIKIDSPSILKIDYENKTITKTK